ncbi:ANTAR domain-containing protein [Streptomyces sp. NPDC042319]|uniref:ANTAR domain-containing protein n=1 Tax=Streptomyces sp. NPDC042319 TaxID=3154332 RepID=UPI0033F1BC64
MPMSPEDPVSPEMAAVLAMFAPAAPGLAQVPADRCAETLGLTGVTVSALTRGRSLELIWHAPADTLGAALEDLQYTLGEGPSLECAHHNRAVLEPDLARTPETRWPVFLPDALHVGAGAFFAFSLRIGAIQLGVFAGYRTRPGALGPQQYRDALSFTDSATYLLLGGVPAAGGRRDPLADLAALHRAEVHQATGMLSVRLRISLDEALLAIRTEAFSSGRPLLEVARDVIARRETPDVPSAD